jgi:hypothetical protein
MNRRRRVRGDYAENQKDGDVSGEAQRRGGVKTRLALVLVICGAAVVCGALRGQTRGDVQVWLTNPDKSAVFEEQKPLLKFGKDASREPTAEQESAIDLDEQKKFQTIDGFGFALTGGSAQHLARMDAPKRGALLHELFAVDGKNIGISYLRISIGSSDLNDHVYSYDDLAVGETDPELKKFSLAADRVELIPVLKEILAINPKIEILGSPWSAPAWIKTNWDAKGGRLKAEYYASYAKYFVKYVQGMKAAGIRIAAITVQNEPLNDKNREHVDVRGGRFDINKGLFGTGVCGGRSADENHSLRSQLRRAGVCHFDSEGSGGEQIRRRLWISFVWRCDCGDERSAQRISPEEFVFHGVHGGGTDGKRANFDREARRGNVYRRAAKLEQECFAVESGGQFEVRAAYGQWRVPDLSGSGDH